MEEKRKISGGEEVLITVSSDETLKGSGSKDADNFATWQSKPNSPLKESPDSMSNSSPKTSRFSLSPNKRPKFPLTTENLTRRKPSVYAKPKSRFGEQPVPVDASVLEDDSLTLQQHMVRNSPFNIVSPDINSSTLKSPLMASFDGPSDDEEEVEEDIVKKVESNQAKRKKAGIKAVVQWIPFVCVVGCLVASLTVKKLKNPMIWGLEFWKWSVLVLVTLSGMSITNWIMQFIVFLIERNFLLKKKVLYFVYGLKKNVQVFVWIGLVLLAWEFLFTRGIKRSKTATKVLKFVTWTLISILVGSFLWLVKNTLLKILESNFHVNRFFDRIQETVFCQYVLQTLSGPPLIEEAERVGKSPSSPQMSFKSFRRGRIKEKKVIDMGMVHKMKQEKVSAWTMKVLIDAVTNSGLSIISNTLDDESAGVRKKLADMEITNEMEATSAAYHIFRNVAKPGWNYIDEEDLLRFVIKEEVDLVFPLFAVSDNRQIDRKSLTDWVVKVYKGRKALAHALGDTKTAVIQLNKLVTGILIIVTFIVWLLLMEIATTKVLVLLSSQLVVVAIIFGNTCKTIFEAIIFVFVMHPFDVGDRCVVDGVPLLVEEMNILSTVFLKLDNEKIYFPNSVLATKPISNYYRSPDMGDTVEFSIDFATPTEKIGLLKDKVKHYLERNPQHWHRNHSVVVREIENENNLRMALYCNYTMNFQEYIEKNKRRTELVLEIKRIFEELSVQYHLLPQQVYLRHLGTESTIVAKM
ncbi:mechanosensitive ion channel protein 10-like [Mercurialis annua]|uniref:mechanosensitive ion channel protein 10-like n=1 Tax=Mercurialis annua TaxID=3986 RepID=UPI0021603F91|nr:mechanosensitive ion channel protein 10-like [Mercurialis annua]